MSFRCMSAKIKWGVALPVMILLLSSCGINGVVRSSPEFQITNNPYHQYRPAISESYVVWEDDRNDNADIYGFNLETQEEFQITDNPRYQTHPSISGSYVVWEDSRNGNADIYGFNLETQEEFRITRDSSDQRYPKISGNLVVWQDDRHHTNWEIYGFDLSTNQEIRITKNEYDQKSPKVSGNTVVWIDKRSGKETIYGYDLLTGQEFQVLEDDFSGGIALCDDTLVFQEEAHGGIFTCAYRISTGEKTQIETGPCLTLDLQESVIVWSQIHSGDYSEPYISSEILGYDLSTERLLQISSGNRIMMFPKIYGDTVVWQDDRNGNVDIFGCTLDGVPFHIVHPRPPLEYYYGLLSVLSVLGGVLLIRFHPARKTIRSAGTAGLHEFRKSLRITMVFAGFAVFFMFQGFFTVYYMGFSFGIIYPCLLLPYLTLAFWYARTPYVLMSQSEITLFEQALRGPRVIKWEEIQNISFNQKGSRIDLQILDDGLVGIRFCDLGKKEKADILRVLQTRFPSLKEPT